MSKTIVRESRLAVGLISGTSMDGIDAALVRLTGSPAHPRVRLLAFVACPYPPAIRQRLMRVASGQPTTAAEISELNFLLGELFADAAIKVCSRAGISVRRLAVIGSHGQTIFHQGPSGTPARIANQRKPVSFLAGQASTLQIGEPAVIAHKTGAPVVADFRPADLAAGGQGAPLVPLLDYLLLRDTSQGTVALNIGGIANITVIPAGSKPGDVFGFDTGPGNMVMDALVRHFKHGEKPYDAGGRLAAQGVVLELVLDEILRLPFLSRYPPKSAGREQFGAEFVKRYFLSKRGAVPQLPRPNAAHNYDLLRTATELTARTITDAIERFVFPDVKIQRLIISGGGAHNPLLVRRLAALLPELSVCLSDQFGLPVDAKEAIAFAVLADRTLHGLPGNLPSVTGARKPVILGAVTRT